MAEPNPNPNPSGDPAPSGSNVSGESDPTDGSPSNGALPPLTERPEFVPEKFWQPDQNPTYETIAKALATSYGELETAYMRKTDDLREEALPAARAQAEKELYDQLYTKVKDDHARTVAAGAPETYALDTSGIQLPEGVKLELAEDDPMVDWWRGFARSHGLTQDDFNAGLEAYIGQQVRELPDRDAEIQALGEGGAQRMEVVERKLAFHLPKDQYQALVDEVESAASLQALETLTHHLHPPGPADVLGIDIETPILDGNPVTLESLRQLQASEAYENSSHPDHAAVQEQVRKGYLALRGNAIVA